jgi:hypothetical protein
VLAAAERLGVDPATCVVIGDIGADVEAAEAAGAVGVLVPNERTRPAEVAAAARVAPTLDTALDRWVLLPGTDGPSGDGAGRAGDAGVDRVGRAGTVPAQGRR